MSWETSRDLAKAADQCRKEKTTRRKKHTKTPYSTRQGGSNFTLQARFYLSTWLCLARFTLRQALRSPLPSWASFRFCSQSLLFNKAHLEQGKAVLTKVGLHLDSELTGCSLVLTVLSSLFKRGNLSTTLHICNAYFSAHNKTFSHISVQQVSNLHMGQMWA